MIKNFLFGLCLAALVAIGFSSEASAYTNGFIYVDCDGSACTGSNGALATNSGSTNTSSPTLTGTAATLVTSTTSVTLDTNTNISTVAGCSAGTCDGSQSIFIVNASNASRRIFWILSYTGCTGSGSCVLTVDTAVTCATCTAGNWTIGGRYLFPSGQDLVAAAMRAGDTLQFNTSPQTRGNAIISYPSGTLGNTTNGRASIIGKPGVSGITITAATSGATSVLGGNGNGIYIGNLTIINTGTGGSTAAISGQTSNNIIQNVKVTNAGTSTSAHCISAVGGFTVIDSELGPCGGSGLSTGSASGLTVYNNYIHGNAVDGLVSSVTGAYGSVLNNVIANNTGRGINFTGTASSVNSTYIYGNTIYGNGNSGIEVSSGGLSLHIRDNIVQATTTAIATVKYLSGTAEFAGIHDHNVFWNSVDSASGLTGLTTNATEFTSNPAMVAPGSGNFAIANSSPAAGSGYFGSLPIAGASIGFRDIGAIQRNAAGGSGAPPMFGGT